jgi:hypothetical protein
MVTALRCQLLLTSETAEDTDLVQKTMHPGASSFF